MSFTRTFDWNLVDCSLLKQMFLFTFLLIHILTQVYNALNAKYNSNLPGVNPLDYTGLYID